MSVYFSLDINDGFVIYDHSNQVSMMYRYDRSVTILGCCMKLEPRLFNLDFVLQICRFLSKAVRQNFHEIMPAPISQPFQRSSCSLILVKMHSAQW